MFAPCDVRRELTQRVPPDSGTMSLEWQLAPTIIAKHRLVGVRSAMKRRTYDAQGYARRAGCLCFKSDREQEVLLISSNSSPDKWIVPAGGVEIGETANQAAVREVLEEAGVRGILGRCIGVFENEISNHRTTVFSLVVTEELEKWEDFKSGRRRAWFSLEKAKELLTHRPIQETYIRRAETTRQTTLSM